MDDLKTRLQDQCGATGARAADRIEALEAELAARDAEIANWIWQWARSREGELTIDERQTADILARAVYTRAYKDRADG